VIFLGTLHTFSRAPRLVVDINMTPLLPQGQVNFFSKSTGGLPRRSLVMLTAIFVYLHESKIIDPSLTSVEISAVLPSPEDFFLRNTSELCKW